MSANYNTYAEGLFIGPITGSADSGQQMKIPKRKDYLLVRSLALLLRLNFIEL